jgi:hypothetical protein
MILNSPGGFGRALLAMALLLAAGTAALGQGTGTVSIDIAALTPKLEPDFTLSRTGEGTPGEWTIVADPPAMGGPAIAQLDASKVASPWALGIHCSAPERSPRLSGPRGRADLSNPGRARLCCFTHMRSD